MLSKRTQQKFSIEEVAKLLGGIPRGTVIRLLDSGELGYYKNPDLRKIGLRHLTRFIKRSEQKAKY